MAGPLDISLHAPEEIGQPGVVPPLFIGAEAGRSTWDTLLSKLRLSGLPADEDTLPIVRSALLRVRTKFYRRLGSRRISELSSYPLVTAPWTPEQVLRSIAAECELSWMRAELMRVLRFATIDGNSPLQQANDEGMVREASGLDLETEIKRLLEDVDRALDFLSGSLTIGQESDIHCTTIEPDKVFPPGHSLFHSSP